MERSDTWELKKRVAAMPDGPERKYRPGFTTGEEASGVQWARIVHFVLKQVLSLPWSWNPQISLFARLSSTIIQDLPSVE